MSIAFFCSGAAVSGTVGGSADRAVSHAHRFAEQIVDTPVPQGRGQGSLTGQSTTATHSSGERFSERSVEQIVDFPEQTVEQIVDISPGGGLGQGSASSAGAADEDFTGGFAHFSPWEKSARAAASPSAELPREVSSWILAAYGETIGSDEWVQFSRSCKPFYWNRRSHETLWSPPEGVKVVWIGEQTAAGGFGTGTRKRVSVLMTSHRFLLADWSRGEGLGIPSPHLGCHIVGSLALQLVLLVTLLALCFLRSRQASCSLSWPVCSRRTCWLVICW